MKQVKGVKMGQVKFTPKEPSLLFCMVKVFYGKFLAGSFMKLVQDGLAFVGPIVLE